MLQRFVTTAAAVLLVGFMSIPGLAQDPTIPADKGEAVTTASGLKYWILEPGKGERKPRAQDGVKAHYSGWFEDGKLFDSSIKRGQPMSFPVGGVIKGWTEALQLMTVGAKWKLFIPYPLGYGEQGMPQQGMPAKANLIFEVELLEVVDGAAFPAANPEAEKALPSGLKYQILKDGEGEPASSDDGVEVKLYCWNTKGDAVYSWMMNSFTADSDRLSSFKLVRRIPLDFMAQVAPFLKVGGSVRCEVPADLCFKKQNMGPNLPPDSVTIWQIDTQKINRLPVKFEKPNLEKMKTTASGLKYEMIKEGTGASPKSSDRVKVHYIGWLEDGKLFDASFLRGDPIVNSASGFIAGWNEGLLLMKEGGTAKFWIPGNLAYGENPRPGSGIPPNATLYFYVELIKVNP